MWPRQSFGESTISDFESTSNFQVKEKKLFKLVQKQRNYALIKNAKFVMFKWTFLVQRVIRGEYNIGSSVRLEPLIFFIVVFINMKTHPIKIIGTKDLKITVLLNCVIQNG